MPVLRQWSESRITALSIPLSEEEISLRVKASYREGVIASTDGFAEEYAGLELTCAAVLIPFAWSGHEWHLVFTRRTETVEHHKGQVSFPGGGCEASETTPEATTLREASEEIGLHPEDVRLLGRLNDVVTITRYRVTPVVGVIPWDYPVTPAPGEVSRVFAIPLMWLADRKNWKEQPFTPTEAQRPVPVVVYKEYDGEVVWGVTGRILLNLITVLELT